jgi:hypothetical protein
VCDVVNFFLAGSLVGMEGGFSYWKNFKGAVGSWGLRDIPSKISFRVKAKLVGVKWWG